MQQNEFFQLMLKKIRERVGLKIDELLDEMERKGQLLIL